MTDLTYWIDAEKMLDGADTYAYLSHLFSWDPVHSPRNLDGLWDRLTEREPACIILFHGESLKEDLGNPLLKLFWDLTEEGWQIVMQSGDANPADTIFHIQSLFRTQ